MGRSSSDTHERITTETVKLDVVLEFEGCSLAKANGLAVECIMREIIGVMKNINIDRLQEHLRKWLSRRTTNSSVRRVGELPLTIGSDRGSVRNENQDRVAVLKVQVGPNHSFIVAALCDGMGGMTEGAICAAQAIASFFTSCCAFSDMAPAEGMLRAAHEANKMVHSLYHGRGGATLSAFMFDSRRGVAGINIGDSRIYSYKEGVFEQVTVDDTMAGLLPKVEDNIHPRNELLQFIGIGEGLEPHIITLPSSQELIVLTSDGVHFLGKDILQMVIRNANEPPLAAKRIIDLAQWCGGRDNASIAIAVPAGNQWQKVDDSEVIQIWDPFGELQIIIPGISCNGVTGSDITTKDSPHAIKNQKPQKDPKGQKDKTKSNKRKKANVEIPKGNSGEAEKVKPQLKISFEVDESENRHA